MTVARYTVFALFALATLVAGAIVFSGELAKVTLPLLIVVASVPVVAYFDALQLLLYVRAHIVAVSKLAVLGAAVDVAHARDGVLVVAGHDGDVPTRRDDGVVGEEEVDLLLAAGQPDRAVAQGRRRLDAREAEPRVERDARLGVGRARLQGDVVKH